MTFCSQFGSKEDTRPAFHHQNDVIIVVSMLPTLVHSSYIYHWTYATAGSLLRWLLIAPNTHGTMLKRLSMIYRLGRWYRDYEEGVRSQISPKSQQLTGYAHILKSQTPVLVRNMN